MFAAIAQLIQAEVPQEFSANAKKTATEGDATGGAFAELLALLQATPVVAAEAEVETEAGLIDVPIEEVETEIPVGDKVVDEAVEEVVPEATAEPPPEADVPLTTATASATAASTNPVPATAVSASSSTNAEAGPVPGTSSAFTKPIKLAAAATVTETEASVEESAMVQPEKAVPKVSELAKPITAKTSAEAAELEASDTLVVPLKAKVDPQSKETAVLPKLAEAKPTGPRFQVQHPESEPVQEEIPVTAKAEATVAKVAATDAVPKASKQEAAEVVVTKAAPVVVALDPEIETPETPETEVEGVETVDEAPARRQRPSLFASLSRKDDTQMETSRSKDVEALRVVDVHRGRPVTMRAMLLMDATETPRAEAATVDSESPVKVESAAGVERASTMSRSEAAPRAEAPAAPEPPTRSTLPELAKTTLRGVRYLASNGERTITVKLVPESLGELRLDVVTKGEEVSIRMSSVSPVVRDALEGQLAGLRDQLAKDGVDVKRIDVSSDMNGNGDRSQQPSREAGSETARAFARMARSMPHRGFAATESAPTAYTPRTGFHRGDLNVFA